MRLTFTEFRDWLLRLDRDRGGQPPDLVQWWELKQRLEAIDAADTPPRRTASPAAREADIEDMPARTGPVDPEPGDFRALSRQKDGGVSAEAVDVLRRSAPPSREAP